MIDFGKGKKINFRPDGWREIYDFLYDLYISSFKWVNMPPTVNVRFLEEQLFKHGGAAFFKNDVIGHIALHYMGFGELNLYYEPSKINVIGGGGFTYECENRTQYIPKKYSDISDAVIIYDRYSKKNSAHIRLEDFAKQIWDIEKTIYLNVHGQKTPFLMRTSKKNLLTLKNIYQQLETFEPAIFIDDELDIKKTIVELTPAPFVADKLYTLKKNTWNETLNYIGIDNNSSEKKERLTDDEVQISNGLSIASRNSRLNARKMACEMINKVFNLNIDVEVNNETILKAQEAQKTQEGDGENG